MKINELIDEINEFPNYRADSSGGKIYVYTTGPDDNCFMELDCNDSNLSNAEFSYSNLEYAVNSKGRDLGSLYALLNLISDFINTPIEKRYSDKKYTVKALKYSSDSYLVCAAGGNYFFGCLKMHDAYGDQVSFTKGEIEEMKLNDELAIDWNKATIEEDKRNDY